MIDPPDGSYLDFNVKITDLCAGVSFDLDPTVFTSPSKIIEYKIGAPMKTIIIDIHAILVIEP